MKLLNFALIKLTLSLILGILFAAYISVSVTLILGILSALVLALAAILIIEKGQLVKSVGFGIVALLTFFVIGIFTYQFHDHKNFKTHYTHHLDTSEKATATVMFRVREVLKSTTYHDKYSVDNLQINNQSLTGKTLLNLPKDALYDPLQVDDILVSATGLQDLKAPVNPNQFDYKAHLEKQYIYHQIFAERDQLLPISSEIHTLLGYAANLRRSINTELNSKHFKADELALINALLLGQRQDISSEIYDSYSRAGAIHILAVSGLHVGVILYLLNLLFKRLDYIRHGKLIKTILIVLLLWSFAVIAGLSASVTRAVMMFSVVAIGMNLKRPANIYNTLVISMFFLLLFKPMFLFDVGFQMSYLAVLAIVSIQPWLAKLWQPESRSLKKIWQILSVTLAAQIGVVPISLFYFHQFPGLFFLSNLVIIPFLGLILGLGIIVIFLALVNLLPLWFSEVYGSIISYMNHFVGWVSLQERFVFKDIAFSLLQVVAAYVFIFGFVLLIRRQNFRRLAFVMVGVLCFQLAAIYDNYSNQSEAFVVFHKNRNSLIAIKSNARLEVHHNLNADEISNNTSIRNYKIGNAIRAIHYDSLENIYRLDHHTILVVDSLGVFRIPKLHPDYVLLRDSPKINLTRLIETSPPKMIIADGSNYKSYIQRWEATCAAKKIPFHKTSEKGAFILKR
ncbi:ComEC family competence protein [Gelidibacter salicanalis]|uniref:ComEC family competence protein n=1 Tax=Gelidibacter salicanalis TaxID=291193 RepID=A0A5C7ALD2_9FLAO|nr:ComEC/Rec2 family competence protein [Gelidibacter salicanalis]TXE09231.1 ComEC family competence protein [Gelidibacter salicanalis]